MRTGSHRVTGTLLASGFLAGWIAAVWVSPPPVVTQTVPPRPTPAVPAVEMPRVALDRVGVSDARPDARRNPFAFRERDVTPRPAATRTEVAPTMPEPDTAPVAIDRFPWQLVGLASSDDGTSSTAIVSGRGDVFLLQVGERLPDDTEVIAIDGDQVTVKLASGESRVLDLR